LGALIGYAVLSGKKKAVEVLISIGILKFIQISLYGSLLKSEDAARYHNIFNFLIIRQVKIIDSEGILKSDFS
jgi:hypothetical protein